LEAPFDGLGDKSTRRTKGWQVGWVLVDADQVSPNTLMRVLYLSCLMC
jgi:hypothetical protein